MTASIRITAGELVIEGQLNDSPTAEKIAAALPLRRPGRRWGQEIYFAIPVKAKVEPGAREVVEAGELGYWPRGDAFCIFFGPTPASSGDEIRAASPVNIIGNLNGDLSALSKVADGAEVLIERI